MTGRWRIGIDVGGTFNDFVAVDSATGRRATYKEPSTPSDPSLAVEQGLKGLMQRHGLSPQDIGAVIHGTTLALNTILQRRGARLAMVVSAGNRDVFEIGRAQMPMALDFTAEREEPLIPAERVFEIGARIQADGILVAEPGEADIDTVAALIRQARVEAVVVMLVNAYRHPGLERRLGAALAARLPGMPISESAAVWPEAREYERGLIAALNAYVQPLMEGYYDRLASRLAALGITAPVFITANNGGTVSIATARARPIDTVLSGPAAGVVSAGTAGAAASARRLVTFDMGGTSADMAVVVDAEPEFTNLARVGDFPIITPVVAVEAIGAGGGSVVWIDAQGVLKVGPESAGSDPGPISYGRGGDRITVTDCYLALGILDPDAFLGGRMRLDPAPALAALDALAARLGLAGADRAQQAAFAALKVATAMMAVDVGKLLARRGMDKRDFALVAYGGAGATHATLLAAEAGLPRVVVPLSPGTFCALGAATAAIRRDFTAPLGTLLGPDGSGFDPVAAALAATSKDAARWASAEAGEAAALTFRALFTVRFPDQAYELEVLIGPDRLPTLDGRDLVEAYHARHQALYGFADRGAPVRVGALRLTVAAPAPVLADPPARAQAAGDIASRRRRVWHDGGWMDAQVQSRAALGPGAEVAGPLLIEQEDTTVWILPGWRGRVLGDGSLLLHSPHP